MESTMSLKKRIGIDARFFAEAGPGRYAKNIVEHLEKVDTENEYVVFLRKRGWDAYQPKNPNFHKVFADYKWYSWQEQTKFLWLILRSKVDILYVPHFNIPVLYPKKLVTAIPDLIMHTFSTEVGTTLPKFYFKFKKYIYKLVFYWAVIRSEKVIVPSRDVLNDFRKIYPSISENKYVLAYEGIDPAFMEEAQKPEEVLNKLGINEHFLLYVGSAYIHKNLQRLVEAFKKLVEKYNYTGQLIIVGKKDKFAQQVSRLVTTMNLQDKILIPGLNSYVDDREVTALRTRAALCVFPSLKEGFSLTPLESQQAKLPCVISDIPCHREIYEDSVLYFDPYNVDDMADKINHALKDLNLRQSLIEKGLKNVTKYSWLNTAKITYEVFREI